MASGEPTHPAPEDPELEVPHPTTRDQIQTPSSETQVQAADTGPDSLRATGEVPECENSAAKVCQFFRKKKCRFGDKCRLSHSDPSPDDADAVSPDPDTDDKHEEETMNKQKKGRANKASKKKYSDKKEVNKKPRMRTADEVISRILWDSSVDASEFVVGYVDRFLGVLERPFCDFNWETSPFDCDYSNELALPRHRIQYFTYRGHRVWDRHTRTDRVFGSTGQSLAPPFGGEEEVKEKHTEDQETAEDQSPNASTQDDSDSEEPIHGGETCLEVAHPATECEEGISQEDQEAQEKCSGNEATKRPQASTIPAPSQQEGENAAIDEGEEKKPEEKWEESWEGHEDIKPDFKPLQIKPRQTAPLEQRDDKSGRRPPKKRPTHFITFRANTPAILSSFQQLEKEVSALLPAAAPHWLSASSLHVTMCLLVLRSPDEVEVATKILQQFASLDRNPPVAVTFPVKLKHFSGRVLYLSPQPQLPLQQLNSGLQEAYRRQGLLHRDSYNPRYHLTLAKDSDGDKIFGGVGDLKDDVFSRASSADGWQYSSLSG
uniref:C3H1-type domain-containing protein n=1 Tax=Gouania willdenowi TaxID=441366 RepID=A0A8C5DDS3_GOUWI